MSFAIGDRVVVVVNHYTSCRLTECHGTVESKWFEKYGVRIDDKTNSMSDKGLYYFKTKQLKKETNVTMANTSNIMEGNYRIALVRFLEGTNTDRDYEYACYDADIERGDRVVVMSANHGIGIGKVTDTIDKDDRKIYREIICKADFTNYANRVKAREQRAIIMRKMRERADALHEMAIYRTLAKDDPEMSGLLSELEVLGNEC